MKIQEKTFQLLAAKSFKRLPLLSAFIWLSFKLSTNHLTSKKQGYFYGSKYSGPEIANHSNLSPSLYLTTVD